MKYAFTFSFLSGIALSFGMMGCGNGTEQPTPPASSTDSTKFRPIETDGANKLSFCKDWQWQEETFDIVLSKDCAIMDNGELHLGFAEDLIIERPKDPNIEVNSPFGALEEGGGAYANYGSISVNGKPYTGRIKGFHTKTKQQVLDLWLQNGRRYGMFTVWSSEGRPYERDFTQEVSVDIMNSTTRKPIIYFYPPTTTDLTVHLDFAGELTTTYPKYNAQTGWKVKAEPNGTLHDEKGREYYALYWEGEGGYKYDLSTGFVVKGKESASFLEEKLAMLGLNRREANEFINYWLPVLETQPYNLIHFAGKAYTDQAHLTITPQPETLIRVLMVYQPLQKPVAVQPQILPQMPQRKGFTVVEWGGVEQSDAPQLVK